MDIREFSDDFFSIGKISILNRTTNNDRYDYNFRNNLDCRSIVSETENPVLLHIGAIEDYAGIETYLEENGMKLLIHEAEHLRCSTIEKWYPSLKEKTPFTIVYDELPPIDELLKDFSFPVFIKGNRQTNRHKKSQCIIEDAEAYERLCLEWEKDPVLHWQKVAVREYVPLLTVDDVSFPDQVPISYEFRFFYFEGKCMGYGPYWYMGHTYTMLPEDIAPALELADWAAERLMVSFPAIDLAKTASGEWIIIEVNDAQESGFVGLNPIPLWKNTIDAMQERNWIPAEELFPEGTVIMGSEPLAGVELQDMEQLAAEATSSEELVKIFAAVHNKFWFIEDDVYDYEEGSEEYLRVSAIVDAWGRLMDQIEERLIQKAKLEGFMDISEEHPHSIVALAPVMEHYGYRDGRGWWVPIEKATEDE